MNNFESFWQMYPRRVGKKAAKSAWLKMSIGEQQAALNAINEHICYWNTHSTHINFIPHPSTWLNQGRWEDELDLTPVNKKPPLPWYSTEQLTFDKARELQMNARPGEDMGQFRSRIAAKIAELA